MKKCTKCLKMKPLSNFHRDKSHSDGRRSDCKECSSIAMKIHNAKPEVKARTKKRQTIYHALPETKILKRSYSLQARYGMTFEEKEEMLKSQNNRCNICRDRLPIEKAYVDHNHITDEVRGILCTHCNRGLGSFRDNIETMANAIEYIKRNKAPDFYA